MFKNNETGWREAYLLQICQKINWRNNIKNINLWTEFQKQVASVKIIKNVKQYGFTKATKFLKANFRWSFEN